MSWREYFPLPLVSRSAYLFLQTSSVTEKVKLPGNKNTMKDTCQLHFKNFPNVLIEMRYSLNINSPNHINVNDHPQLKFFIKRV